MIDLSTNDKVNQFLDKYPLLAKGYDALECPMCETLCFPKVIYANGTIRYNQHKCADPFQPWNTPMKSFSITEGGALKVEGKVI